MVIFIKERNALCIFYAVSMIDGRLIRKLSFGHFALFENWKLIGDSELRLKPILQLNPVEFS